MYSSTRSSLPQLSQSVSNDNKNDTKKSPHIDEEEDVYKLYHGRFRRYRGHSVAQVMEEGEVLDIRQLTNGDDQKQSLPYGLICVPSCLSPEIQQYLNYVCVSQYSQHPPYITNLSTCTSTSVRQTKKARTSNNNPNLWKEFKEKTNTNTTSKKNDGRQPAALLNKKLTWSTVGYAYDWTQRCYRQSLHVPMPSILQNLSHTICKDFYFNKMNDLNNKSNNKKSDENFLAQAGIINYYHLNSNGMGGHRDDAELTFDYPVISVSLGMCPGIFLIQTTEKKTVLPLLLRPGDVIIFFGPLRLALHGMPCVLQPEEQSQVTNNNNSSQSYVYNSFDDIGKGINKDIDKDNDADDSEDENLMTIPKDDLEYLQSYVNTHRININLRQVLPNGMKTIPNSS